MNDFDKIFSDKLHNHKTPPPANGWEQLNAALDKEQNAKKKVIYWRVAAAILLLCIAGAAWWGSNTKLQESPLADEAPVPVEEPGLAGEHSDTSLDQLALEENNTIEDQTEAQEAEPEKPVEKVVDSHSKRRKVEKKQSKVVQQSQPTLAVAETEAVDTTSIQALENIQTLETLAVEPLTISKNELLAIESVKEKVSPPVTIIYKPGVNSTEKDEKGIALALLNDIKNTSITFSDIRNAKAELLAKVFSKKENEVTP